MAEYDQEITVTESLYNTAINSLPSGSAEYGRMMAEKNEAISRLEYERDSYHQENSFIGKIGKFIEPVMRPLGFDWKMSVSLLAGVAAKEVVVSTMGVLYQVSENDTVESLQSKLQSAEHNSGEKTGQPVFTKVTAFAFLMFILLYFPCVAVVAAVRKESGKWKWALFMVSYTTAAAWMVAFLVNQVGNIIIG